MISKPEVGKVYRVIHTRYGTFHMRVDRIEGVIITGTVVNTPHGIRADDRVFYPGDMISVHTTLSMFYPPREVAQIAA